MGKKNKSKFDDQFRANAIALVVDSRRPLMEVAAELGVSKTALYRWVEEAKIDGRKPADETTEQRLKRLESEVSTLRQEREILKKAVAFFAKENK